MFRRDCIFSQLFYHLYCCCALQYILIYFTKITFPSSYNITLKPQKENIWHKYIRWMYKMCNRALYKSVGFNKNRSMFPQSWKKLNFCKVSASSHTGRRIWAGNAVTKLWFTWASVGNTGISEKELRRSGNHSWENTPLCPQPALLFWQNTSRKLLDF